MSDLSLWYEQELTWFRKYAGQFASDHPGLARSLGISDEAVEDPDVARLVESVALLNARMSSRLNEELPQLTDALLEILFPHFLRPLPSIAVMQLPPGDEVNSIQTVPAGSRFRAAIDEERQCEFRTCCDAQLLPFKVSNAQAEFAPFSVPPARHMGHVDAMLRLDFTLCDDSLQFYSIGDLSRLDIFLKGETNLIQRLYDQLFSSISGMVLFDDSGLEIRLPKEALQPVLMDQDERILPLSGNTFPGYQLLLEYMSWQQLFLSLRITDLDGLIAQFNSNSLSIGFYLESMPVELGRALSVDTFQVGCVPIVNLFPKKAEPICIDYTRLGYPLVIDARSDNKMELFSVDSVVDITGINPEPVPEIYGYKYHQPESNSFWHYKSNHSSDHGELSLTDLDLNPELPEIRQLSPELTCSNGDQPLELHLLQSLSCQENIAIPVVPRLLCKASAPWKPERRQANRWALLAHLKLNFEALLGSANPALELKEILSLYNLANSSSQRTFIDAIDNVECQPQVAPIKVRGRQCFVQGTDITLTLDGSRISGVSVMAFVQVLDQLFSGYAGYNSFTRLKVCMKGESGVYYQCQRRQG